MTHVDPERYHTREACREVDSETLLDAYLEAQRVFNRCGGHKLAARMANVMRVVEAELADRNIPIGGE